MALNLQRKLLLPADWIAKSQILHKATGKPLQTPPSSFIHMPIIKIAHYRKPNHLISKGIAHIQISQKPNSIKNFLAYFPPNLRLLRLPQRPQRLRYATEPVARNLSAELDRITGMGENWGVGEH